MKSFVGLPETGFLRLPAVLALIGLGRTRWLNGVKAGEFPAPVRLTKRAVAWRAEDVKNLIDRLGSGQGGGHK